MDALYLQMISYLPEWGVWAVTGIVAACAAISTTMKAPTETSGTAYLVFYKVVNFIGFNFGKAKNADEK